jgi:hypothetical protein
MKISRLVIVSSIGAAALVASGCKSSSRSSVRTYDYDDSGAPRAVSKPVETEREVESGEWEMVAPGEMVVEPRR